MQTPSNQPNTLVPQKNYLDKVELLLIDIQTDNYALYL